MLRRRAMVGRPVARVGRAVVGTAVVVGTAGAVSHHQQKKYAQQEATAQQQYDQAYQQGVADAQVPQEAYEPPAPDLTAQLQQIAQLHDAGVLSDEEFAAAKQKLLAS
jgi:Short C-terminal domain